MKRKEGTIRTTLIVAALVIAALFAGFLSLGVILFVGILYLLFKVAEKAIDKLRQTISTPSEIVSRISVVIFIVLTLTAVLAMGYWVFESAFPGFFRALKHFTYPHW